MRYAIVATLVLGTLAACSSDGVDPSALGSWGGHEILVRSTPAAVDIQLACGAFVRAATPLRLDASGQFAFTDTLRGIGGNRDTLPNSSYSKSPVRVTGRVIGDSLSVSLLAASLPQVHQYGARKGAPSDVAGLVCRA